MSIQSLEQVKQTESPNTTELTPSKQPTPKRKGKKWSLRLFLLFLLSGIGYLAYRQVFSQPQGPQGMAVVPLERTTFSITVSANGFVEPEQSINVSPKTAGIMTSLLVKEGDFVNKGQALARMDSSNLQGQLLQEKGRLAQAEANLRKLIAGNRYQDIAQAQARLEELEATLRKLVAGNRTQDIGQAQARVNSAQAALGQAEDDLRRIQKLYEAGGISRQVFNQKRADRDAAQAKVMEVKQALSLQTAGTRSEDIDQAEATVKQQRQALDLLKAGNRTEDIDKARAEVTSALGALKSIQIEVDDTIVRAPFAGYVNRKYADPGAFVTPMTAGSSVSSASSSSILALASTNQVVANISESSIAKIRLGQRVEIKADAYPGKTFNGRVSQIATQATVEQNVTSFQVKVKLLADAAKQLRSGMNISTEFKVGQVENAIAVPTIAVTRQNNVAGVFVAPRNRKPVFTPITLGATVDNRTEVKAGLNGTEMVLISLPPRPKPPSGFSFPGFPGTGSTEKEGPPPGGPPRGGGGPPGGGGGPPGR
jgi:HlyD family secretion protein